MTKEDLREIIGPMFDRLETKIDNLQESHGKEIARLDKQSNEHYDMERVLEEKCTERIAAVKQQLDTSALNQGERVGQIERDITADHVSIKNMAAAIAKMESGSRWKIEMWIVIGVAAAAPFLARLL